MGNYSDFLRIHAKEGARLRRLYWVYGEEEMFRILAVRRLKELADVPAHNVTHLSAFDTRESDIWAVLNQHPLDLERPRLLVVYEAQRLEKLERVQAWLKDNQTTRIRSATVIFVSSESEISEEVSELTKSSNAMPVRCALPKNEDDRLKRSREVIQSWGPIEGIAAGVLAQRVNFDMADAYSVVRKAGMFPNANLTVNAINLLAPRKADQDLTWALVSCQRKKAAEAIPEVPMTQVGRVIGGLSTHVEALSRINATLTSDLSYRETAKRLQLKEGYVRMLHTHAKFYPRKQAVRRILLLNEVDAAWQSGAREGVLEVLVAGW